MSEQINQATVNAHRILEQTNCMEISHHTGQFYSSFKESKTEIVELLAKALFKSVHLKNSKLGKLLRWSKFIKLKV